MYVVVRIRNQSLYIRTATISVIVYNDRYSWFLYIMANFFQSVYTLVTQPMLQLRPNWSSLRSMDSYIQILCKDDFLVQGSDGEGTFGLHFRNLHKIWT